MSASLALEKAMLLILRWVPNIIPHINDVLTTRKYDYKYSNIVCAIPIKLNHQVFFPVFNSLLQLFRCLPSEAQSQALEHPIQFKHPVTILYDLSITASQLPGTPQNPRCPRHVVTSIQCLPSRI